jgi:hypothetical protein
MVASAMKNTAGKAVRQGKAEGVSQAAIIKDSTPFDTCSEKLTAFGGFLSLVKVAGAIGVHDVFASHWISLRCFS